MRDRERGSAGVPRVALRDGPVGAVLRVDTLALSPAAGARLALVTAVAGVLPWLAGHRELVPPGAIGALLAGVVALLSPRRSRATATAAAAVLLAVAAVLGSALFAVPVAYTAVLAVLAFGSGVLAPRGPPLAVCALQATVAFVTIGPTVAMAATSAADHLVAGAAVAGGGLLQWVGVVLDPVRARYVEHRRAVALSYRRLADHLDAVATGTAGRLPGRPHARAAMLAGASSTRPSSRVLALAAEAERLRAAVARLEDLTTGRPQPPGTADRLHDTARRLRAIARGEAVPGAHRSGAHRSGAHRSGLHDAAPDTPLERALDRLTERVGAAEQALAMSDRVAPGDGLPGGGPDPGRSRRAGWRLPPPSTWWRLLSAQRHPWRLTAAVLVAELVASLLPVQHGYWVTFTALLVLRPDYASTRHRALARVLGTVVGSALALALVQARPAPVVLLAVAAVSAWLLYTTFEANFALFTFGITVTISIVLDADGRLTSSTIGERVFDIALGSAIALVAIRVWPTRLSESIGATLAAAVAAEGRFGAAVLRSAVGAAPSDAVVPALVAARAARLTAAAAVAQGTTEPRGWRGSWWVPASAAVRAARDMADAGLRMWSVDELPGTGPAARAAGLELADAVEHSAAALAERLASPSTEPLDAVSDLGDRVDAFAAATADGVVRDPDTDLVVVSGSRLVAALGVLADATAQLVGLGEDPARDAAAEPVSRSG